jgi:hypothetical protein
MLISINESEQSRNTWNLHRKLDDIRKQIMCALRIKQKKERLDKVLVKHKKGFKKLSNKNTKCPQDYGNKSRII